MKAIYKLIDVCETEVLPLLQTFIENAIMRDPHNGWAMTPEDRKRDAELSAVSLNFVKALRDANTELTKS
jgi:hypothetical protein